MSCTITADKASAVFAQQATLLYGNILQDLTISLPWLDVLEKGTFPANSANILQSVAQGIASTSGSRVAPVVTPYGEICSSAPADAISTGEVTYNYELALNQGISDKICLTKGFYSFSESLIRAMGSVQNAAKEFINADVRWQLFQRSGVKCVVQANKAAEATIFGGFNAVDTAVPAVHSDTRLTFQFLNSLAVYARTRLRWTPFGSGSDESLRVIAGYEITNKILTDAAIGGVTSIANGNSPGLLTALAQGGNAAAQKALSGYAWTATFRGLQFGQDQEPIRLNWTGAAYETVEPLVSTAGSTGTIAIPNPGYDAASHEVAFLFGKGSFARVTPAGYTGQGPIKFGKQLLGGEVQFKMHPDMGCNLFEDFGVLAYRFARGFKPLRPWFVMPIIFKRCQGEVLASCSGVSGI